MYLALPYLRLFTVLGNWSGVRVVIYSCWALEYLTSFSAVWNLHQHQSVNWGWRCGHNSDRRCLCHIQLWNVVLGPFHDILLFHLYFWLLIVAVYITWHLAWPHSKFRAHRRELRGKRSCKSDPGLCNAGVWVTKSHQPPHKRILATQLWRSQIKFCIVFMLFSWSLAVGCYCNCMQSLKK